MYVALLVVGPDGPGASLKSRESPDGAHPGAVAVAGGVQVYCRAHISAHWTESGKSERRGKALED